jgi:hypothetical protein
VAGVGFHSHQLFSKLLVEVNLARLDDAAVVDRAVLGDGPVGVDLDVDVQGSADLDRFWLVRKLSGCIGGGCVTYVEARDDAVEGGGTISVCGPHSAQPGAVVGDECLVEEGQSCHALDTTFSRCVILTYAEVLSESAVDGDILCGNEVAERRIRVVASERAIRAGCVAMLVVVRTYLSTETLEKTYPETDQDVFHRLAGVDVDHTDVQLQWDADLRCVSIRLVSESLSQFSHLSVRH